MKAMRDDGAFRASRGAYGVLAILFFVNVFSNLDRAALAILLPLVKSDLQLSDTQSGLLVGIAFSAFYAIFGIPLARWADRGDRTKILALSLAGWSVMTVVSGFARSFLELALGRMGVAIGEAGSVPPAHSLISDIFPPVRRAWALAIHTASGPLGTMLGLAFGGVLGSWIGWRATLAVFGCAGIPFALFIHFRMKDHWRGPEVRSHHAASWNVGLVQLFRNVPFVLLLGGFAFGSFAISGLTQWLPTYLVRSFGMSPADVGIGFGLCFGLGSAAGMLMGGAVAAKLAARDERWTLWIASLSYVFGLPIAVGIFIVPQPVLALGLVLLFSGFVSLAYGPAFAMIQTLAPPEGRALATAVALFISSLIGGGLGPVAIGALSDALSNGNVAEGLRVALLSLTPVLAIPALFYWAASRTLRR